MRVSSALILAVLLFPVRCAPLDSDDAGRSAEKDEVIGVLSGAKLAVFLHLRAAFKLERRNERRQVSEVCFMFNRAIRKVFRVTKIV